jgi:nitroreductase
MDLETAVKERRSIRRFTTEPVPKLVLEDILEAARWSPSWGNTQVWEFTVLTGEPLEAFRKTNFEKLSAGEPFRTDVPIPETWPDHMKKRYGELGKVILDVQGVRRDDKEGRKRLYSDMARLFGAPCLLVACIPRDTRVEYALLDIGIITQTICLLAHGKGLGTCIMAAAVGYPDVLRKMAAIPDNRKVVLSIAVGYPEASDPMNTFQRPRAALGEFVRWVG